MSCLPLVIANPQAGNGSGRDRWWANSGLVADRLGPHDLVWTEERGHAERIARAEGNERSLLIAYGGDGTASEVARGLALSGGSAELGLSSKRHRQRLCQRCRDPCPLAGSGPFREPDPGPAYGSWVYRGRGRDLPILSEQFSPWGSRRRLRKGLRRAAAWAGLATQRPRRGKSPSSSRYRSASASTEPPRDPGRS